MVIAALILLSFILVLIVPATAHAWGPATHLEIGQTILNNPSVVTSAIRDLILKFPQDFLYGTISADIVMGKNMVEELKHCHNWKVGFRLLKKAEAPSKKAFAYGYLSHLAADTIAHNYFIPEMMIRTFQTRILKHLYWELRFDALAQKGIWLLPRKMVKGIHRDNDILLDSIIEDSPLSFKTNKKIFSSLLILNRMERWHRMLQHMSNASRWKLDHGVRGKFFDSSLTAVADLLSNQHLAECVKRDPTGKRSLEAAKITRKKLKIYRKQKGNWEEALEEALRRVSMEPRDRSGRAAS
ncbi:MAG: zinc dependent phospholipase C family protein [Thermodesulfobacteriota bacterium]|nr:MAG: zinc dependent phospholipase C family protein [Thermodesulfobacteriota bacterium]